MEHGGGEFDQGAVAPERILRAELRVEAVGHERQQIVAMRIAKVAGGDFRDHVVAAEGCRGVACAAGLEAHVAHRRQCVPPQVKVGEPRQGRVGDGNLEHGIRRHGEETRLFAGDFNEEGKNIESRAVAGRGPTGLEEARGEVCLRGITQHGAVVGAVTGIADKLVIVDARPGGVRPRGGEDGDERLDASAIGRAPEVGDAGFENSPGGGDVPRVDHIEGLPEAAPDAAAAVAPGEAAGEGEFFRGLPVEAVMPDFFGRLCAAGGVRGGVVLTRKLIEKGMRGPDRIGGVARFVGEERGVVRREAPATKGTLRGDVH